MLLAPCKRHSLHRQFTPEPAPQRHCTFGPHLLLLRLSSSLVSVGLALPTPARNTHTFACHRTKPAFRRTESCPSNWRHIHTDYFNSSNNNLGTGGVLPSDVQRGLHQSPPGSSWAVWSQAGSQQLLMQLGLPSSYSRQRLASRQWMLATINNYQFRIDSNSDWRLKASPYPNANCPASSGLSIVLPFFSCIYS